jgi:calcineurin-like phosphoesterase family protein
MIKLKSKNKNIWFTSDTHFSDQRILDLSKRPFENIEEMDMYLINNWNMNIGEKDRIFHLGDFGNFKAINLLKFGKMYFLEGNHERKNNEILSDYRVEYLDNNIIDIDNILIELVHEPSKRNKDIFCLFGHVHKLSMIKQNALNVGIDCHNYIPIDWETVLFYKNAIQNHYDEEVFLS